MEKLAFLMEEYGIEFRLYLRDNEYYADIAGVVERKGVSVGSYLPRVWDALAYEAATALGLKWSSPLINPPPEDDIPF